MVGLVLDTSAYSHLRLGHVGVLDHLAPATIVHVPVVVLGELHAAFLRGTRVKANERDLQEFLSEPFVSILETTPGVARHYGRVFAALRTAGTPIPINDVWIAASALEVGSPVLTFDRDFERVAGLQVELLRPE